VHELSIARSVVDEVAAAAFARGFAWVSGVRLEVGSLCGVIDGALEFAFELAAAGTPLEGACLEIVRTPVRLWCPTCLKVVQPAEDAMFVCPDCGNSCGELVSGRELVICAFVGQVSAAAAAE
jgi:hydrogenase nickel incorporation protein HypA/HybF